MLIRVSTEEKPSSKIVFTEDEFIDENLKRIDENNGVYIEFVSRVNGFVNQARLNELSELFKRYDLAYIKSTESTLTSFGERVCKDGGWIKHKQKEFAKIRRNKIIKVIKWVIGIIAVLLAGILPFLVIKCGMDSDRALQTDTYQLQDHKEIQTLLQDTLLEYHKLDSINILKNDSLDINFKD